jgi:putative transposase
LEGFKIYWTWKSQRKGRPRIETEIIQLIKQIAKENPLLGIPHIHGEILKLGFDITGSTAMLYIPMKNGKGSNQRWKTFLQNHVAEIISIDFFCVQTFNFKLLHVLVFLSHGRRKIIHFNVTSPPTSEWATQ